MRNWPLRLAAAKAKNNNSGAKETRQGGLGPMTRKAVAKGRAPMWALACMAQSLLANNSTHALRVLLVTCLVYVECVHGADLLLP